MMHAGLLIWDLHGTRPLGGPVEIFQLLKHTWKHRGRSMPRLCRSREDEEHIYCPSCAVCVSSLCVRKYTGNRRWDEGDLYKEESL